MDLTINDREQTLLICRNFNEDEIKTVLIEQMRVNPIVFYEVLLNSTIDKVFEFNDVAIFYNVVIPGPADSPDDLIIVKIVKKGPVAALFINDVDYAEWDFEEQLQSKYNFEDWDEKDRFSQIEGAATEEVRQTFTGRKDSEAVIAKQEQLNIDYIVFIVADMGLEVIEDTVYNSLWTDTLKIQAESRNLNKTEWRKKQFLKKLEDVQSKFHEVENFIDSKKLFFERVTLASLTSLELKYQSRHLDSRMQDVTHITEKIDCIQSLARKTFQAFVEQSIDAYSFNMDKAMKIFSSVATLFMPLTLASGIWGMNVEVPMQNVKSLWPFFAILGGMVVVMVCMLVYFKKRSWM